jgi:hypothetical protein
MNGAPIIQLWPHPTVHATREPNYHDGRDGKVSDRGMCDRLPEFDAGLNHADQDGL